MGPTNRKGVYVGGGEGETKFAASSKGVFKKPVKIGGRVGDVYNTIIFD